MLPSLAASQMEGPYVPYVVLVGGLIMALFGLLGVTNFRGFRDAEVHRELDSTWTGSLRHDPDRLRKVFDKEKTSGEVNGILAWVLLVAGLGVTVIGVVGAISTFGAGS